MSEQLKVLLVDDEEHILAIIGNRIKSWGYDLITAKNGREAVEMVRQGRADALILDYYMPEMNGLEALRRIRLLDKKIPVIMFTAHPDEKYIAGSDKLGISAYIPKLSVYSDTSSSLKAMLDMIQKDLGK